MSLSVFIYKILLKHSHTHSLIVVIQSLSCVQLFEIPWTAAYQASLPFTNSWSLLKFMSIESMMLSYHLILGCSLLLLPSIFPSLRIFSNELTLHIRWPKYWSFSFSISLSNENSGWFPLGLTDLTSLQSKGLSSVCFSTIVQKHNTKKKLVRQLTGEGKTTWTGLCSVGEV